MVGTSYIEFIGIKGQQANKPQYAANWSISMVLRLLAHEIERVEQLADNEFDNKFIKKLIQELLNPEFSIGLSPISIGVSGLIDFEEEENLPGFGKIRFEVGARLTILDGWHRILALYKSNLLRVRFQEEEIPILLIPLTTDRQVENASIFFQKFHQENIIMQSTKTLSSQTVRELTKELLRYSRFLGRTVEVEANTLSSRSRKLFTLSVLSKASAPMFNSLRSSNVEKYDLLIADYWQSLGDLFMPWKLYLAKRRTGEEIRKTTVLASSAVVVALGRVGAIILQDNPSNWRNLVNRLGSLDWEKKPGSIWEGRTFQGEKSLSGIKAEILACNIMKLACGLELQEDEKTFENLLENRKEGEL